MSISSSEAAVRARDLAQPAPPHPTQVPGQHPGQLHAPEVAGIFSSYARACAATRKLHHSGFHHWDVFRSLPRQRGELAGLPATGLADHPEAQRTEHVCIEGMHQTAGYLIGGFGVLGGIGAAWVLAASGAGVLLSILIVIIIGGGGIVLGAVAAMIMARADQQRVTADAERRGIVLWAKIEHPELQATAMEIMRQHGGEDIHLVPPSL